MQFTGSVTTKQLKEINLQNTIRKTSAYISSISCKEIQPLPKEMQVSHTENKGILLFHSTLEVILSNHKTVSFPIT